MKREDLLTSQNVEAMQAHSLEAYPHEACGYINADNEYKPLENISDYPELEVRFDRKILGDLIIEDQVKAMFHSHPWSEEHPCEFAPSERDMISQINFAVPFILLFTNGEACSHAVAWGDQLERFPLTGRWFQHGITDCYELIRDQKFIEEDIVLPQFPRDWEWWDRDKDLYRDGFPKAKFYEISARESLPGDVVLFRVRSKVPNHGGVIRPNGLLLHHPSSKNAYDPTKLSKEEPLGRWLGMNPIWLRYSENT